MSVSVLYKSSPMMHIVEILDTRTFKTTRFVHATKADAEAQIEAAWGNPHFCLSISHVQL